VLVLVPKHDLAFAAFGNSAASAALHDRVLLWLLRDYIGLDVPDVIATASAVSDLSALRGHVLLGPDRRRRSTCRRRSTDSLPGRTCLLSARRRRLPLTWRAPAGYKT
jgi:hypothetical protein